jgi:alpha/beta superfamily hydrolase
VRSVRFATEDGVSLEGEVHEPSGEPAGSAVICHPLPAAGGSKDHPLLWAIRGELTRRRFVVLAFNFRGVMGSEGEYAGGEKEPLDARAAIDRAREEVEGPTFVAGWSFGGHVALREAVHDERVGALGLVGPPLAEELLEMPPLPSRQELQGLARPVLIVVGEADQFCPVPEAQALARRLPDARIEVVEDADHFFWHRELDVAGRIGEFAEGRLLA